MMKSYRAIVSVLALLALAGLACEFLDEIQQDSNFVQNPDLSSEQREATQAAGVATLNAGFDLTQTAAVPDQAASQTALALATPTSTPDRLRTFSTIEAESTATAQAALTATALARPNQPPVITQFVANFVSADRTTYYEVEATDPDGDDDELKYEWSHSNPCGGFTWDETNKLDPEAEWFHPHPPCPELKSGEHHPGTITVTVTDAQGGQAVYAYTDGSASKESVLTPPP
jgi:hypothetical protein